MPSTNWPEYYGSYLDDAGHMQLDRGYPDIVRPDSSITLPQYMRAFWGLGEQLWDVDFNQNFSYASLFMFPAVNYAKEPYFLHIWPQAPGSAYVYRYPSAGVHPNPEVGDRIRNFYYVSGPGGDSFYKFYPGTIVFSRADRTMFLYDGSFWRPYAKVPPLPHAMEIAFVVTDPKPSKVIATYIAVEPFKLFEGSRWHRMRGPVYQRFGGGNRPYIIRKNGEPIGQTIRTMYTAGATIFEDVEFAAGDRLEIFSPSSVSGLRCFSLSILGERI